MGISHRAAAALAALATAGGLFAAVAAGPAQAAVPRAAAAQVVQVSRCCGRMQLEAGLRGSHGYPHVRGHADYQSWWRHRKVDVSVWNARGLSGHTVIVFVRGIRVGSMRIGRGGSGHLWRGHGVPRCRAGTAIAIRTRAGKLVASGTFRHH